MDAGSHVVRVKKTRQRTVSYICCSTLRILFFQRVDAANKQLHRSVFSGHPRTRPAISGQSGRGRTWEAA